MFLKFSYLQAVLYVIFCRDKQLLLVNLCVSFLPLFLNYYICTLLGFYYKILLSEILPGATLTCDKF